MNTFLRLFALAFCATLLGTGCATVTKGPSQQITVESEPSGALVLVDGVLVGQTPANINLRRGYRYDLRLEKPGYEPYTMEIRPEWNEARARTVRFGIDELTSADTDLYPAEVFAPLERADTDEDLVGELAERILRLDDRLYRGQISRQDHERAMAQLMARYGR